MEAKGDDVAGLSMSLDDIIKRREGDARGGRGRGRGRGAGRGQRGRGRGGAGRTPAGRHARRSERGPQLRLAFEWGSEGEEEVFSATYESQKLVEIKSNGDVVLNSGGSRSMEQLAALNYVCQQIRMKIVVTDDEGWSVQQMDGRWQQRFADEMKCSAFPRRAWHSIKATLEALPFAFSPNEDNNYVIEQQAHAHPEEHPGSRKRKPHAPWPPMPLLPFPFPFMPPAMMQQPPPHQQHSGTEGRGGRGRGRGRAGRSNADARNAPSKRARPHHQF